MYGTVNSRLGPQVGGVSDRSPGLLVPSPHWFYPLHQNNSAKLATTASSSWKLSLALLPHGLQPTRKVRLSAMKMCRTLWLVSLLLAAAEQVSSAELDVEWASSSTPLQVGGGPGTDAAAAGSSSGGGGAAGGGSGGEEEKEEGEEEEAPFDPSQVYVDILLPGEGDTVNSSNFEVALAIVSPVPRQFQRHFNGSLVCISLDAKPYACWPVFEMTRHPRFARVPSGEHTLEAMITEPFPFEAPDDPRMAPVFVRSSWSGRRRFNTDDSDEGSQGGVEEAAPEEPEDKGGEGGEGGNSHQRISMPHITLVSPPEMSTTPNWFPLNYEVGGSTGELARASASASVRTSCARVGA